MGPVSSGQAAQDCPGDAAQADQQGDEVDAADGGLAFEKSVHAVLLPLAPFSDKRPAADFPAQEARVTRVLG